MFFSLVFEVNDVMFAISVAITVRNIVGNLLILKPEVTDINLVWLQMVESYML